MIESDTPEPVVSLRSVVGGGMLAMVGLLFLAGIQAEPSLRAVPVLSSVGIAGAAGGAAFSLLGPWRRAASTRHLLRQVASVSLYGAAVGAGFLAGRGGVF